MTTRDVRNVDALVAVQGDADRRVGNVDVLAAVRNADSAVRFYNFDLFLAVYYGEEVAFGPTDFTGTNGDQWPYPEWYTSTGSGGGDASIQNGKGRLNGSNGNADSGGKGRASQGHLKNQTATGTIQLTGTGEPCVASLWLQSSDDWLGSDPDSPSSGYGVRLPSDSADAELVVVVEGVETQLDTATWPLTTDEYEWLFSRQGRDIGFKLWPVGTEEPKAWLLQAKDDSLPTNTAGGFQLAYYCDVAPASDVGTDFDDVVVNQDPSGFGDRRRIGGSGAIRRSPNTGGQAR